MRPLKMYRCWRRPGVCNVVLSCTYYVSWFSSVIYQSLFTFHWLCPSLSPFLFLFVCFLYMLVVCVDNWPKYCIQFLACITRYLALVGTLIQSTLLGIPGSYWTLLPFSSSSSWPFGFEFTGSYCLGVCVVAGLPGTSGKSLFYGGFMFKQETY